MYWLSRFILMVVLFSNTSFSYLVNIHPFHQDHIYPLCSNCKESFLSNTGDRKCKLFYLLNVVNGFAQYESCQVARSNETLCGLKGKFFFHQFEE